MLKPLLLLLLTPMLLRAQEGRSGGQAYGTPAHTAPNQAGTGQQSEPSPEVRQNLEEGIKHLLVSQVEAWNHGDLEGFMKGYWNSPDLTFYSGTSITKGWAPTLARYKQRYQSEGREMGKLEFQDLDIDLLSRRSAVVTGKWQITMKTGQTPHGLFTLILKRMPEGWRIVHDHTSGG
jgi:beta-aspartyl-peptidase (threonine type)